MMLATGLKSVWLMGRFDPAVAMQRDRARAVHGLVVHRDRAAPHGEPPRRRQVRPVEHQDGRRRRLAGRAVADRADAARSSRTRATASASATARPSAPRSRRSTTGRSSSTSRCRSGGRCRRWSSRSAIRTASRVPEGDEGEVCVRGPMVMPGYWRRPEATAETITPDRWLRTGDIGRMEGGRLYLSSRKRDLIFRGGENVYPVEIEKRIEDHPDVEECAVIGVDDPELGQTVKAVRRAAARPHDRRRSRARVVRGASSRTTRCPSTGRSASGSLPRNAAGQDHEGRAARRRRRYRVRRGVGQPMPLDLRDARRAGAHRARAAGGAERRGRLAVGVARARRRGRGRRPDRQLRAARARGARGRGDGVALHGRDARRRPRRQPQRAPVRGREEVAGAALAGQRRGAGARGDRCRPARHRAAALSRARPDDGHAARLRSCATSARRRSSASACR